MAMNTTGVLAGDLKNITIENLTVTGWAPGILINRVTDSTLMNLQVTGNQEGILLNGSPGATVRDCMVFDNIPLKYRGGILWRDRDQYRGFSTSPYP